ncbi:MAG: hypothetical protein RBT11_06105 [Desulfobacterales bacterium]|nr:hypothetical protein [Desulfobacterales bacterium]
MNPSTSVYEKTPAVPFINKLCYPTGGPARMDWVKKNIAVCQNLFKESLKALYKE